jgi:hypothetical protein
MGVMMSTNVFVSNSILVSADLRPPDPDDRRISLNRAFSMLSVMEPLG